MNYLLYLSKFYKAPTAFIDIIKRYYGNFYGISLFDLRISWAVDYKIQNQYEFKSIMYRSDEGLRKQWHKMSGCIIYNTIPHNIKARRKLLKCIFYEEKKIQQSNNYEN